MLRLVLVFLQYWWAASLLGVMFDWCLLCISWSKFHVSLSAQFFSYVYAMHLCVYYILCDIIAVGFYHVCFFVVLKRWFVPIHCLSDIFLCCVKLWLIWIWINFLAKNFSQFWNLCTCIIEVAFMCIMPLLFINIYKVF